MVGSGAVRWGNRGGDDGDEGSTVAHVARPHGVKRQLSHSAANQRRHFANPARLAARLAAAYTDSIMIGMQCAISVWSETWT